MDWKDELWEWGMLWGWEDEVPGWEFGRRKLLVWKGEALRLISGVGRKEAFGWGGSEIGRGKLWGWEEGSS